MPHLLVGEGCRIPDETCSRTLSTPFVDRFAFVSVLFFCQLDILSLFLSFPRHVAWIVMERSRLLFSRPLLVWILIVTHGTAPMKVLTKETSLRDIRSFGFYAAPAPQL